MQELDDSGCVQDGKFNLTRNFSKLLHLLSELNIAFSIFADKIGFIFAKVCVWDLNSAKERRISCRRHCDVLEDVKLVLIVSHYRAKSCLPLFQVSLSIAVASQSVRK